jgi:hypothetical protein
VIDHLKFWTAFALIAVTVLFLGWRQPLRYRFMSAKQIVEEQASPTPTPWIYDRGRSTKLDRGAYDEVRWSSDRGYRR